jgi:hypothetical protein
VGGAQSGRDQEILAHVLWAGLGKAFASHRSAGYLMRLDGLRQAPIEILTTRKLNPVSGVISHRVPEILSGGQVEHRAHPDDTSWAHCARPSRNPRLGTCGRGIGGDGPSELPGSSAAQVAA